MLSEQHQQLKLLQEEKLNLVSQIQDDNINNNTKKRYNQRIINIQNEMGKLNKFDDNEKNINAIWIGIPPIGEFDNLKLWAKYNQDYKVHIWTDFTHILSHKLGSIISANSKVLNNNKKEHDYQLEAALKDEFYNNYQLKNQEKTFDENARQFLLDKKYASSNIISSWLKEGKEKIIQERKEVQKYTANQVILHDVAQEKDNIFSNEEYYNGYLKNLEYLHIPPASSDRLRYALLDKFGGVYLDTDFTPMFNLKDIKNNKKLINLIDELEWDTSDNSFNRLEKKPEIVMNQIILFNNLTQLNDENLKNFSEKWEKVFKGDSSKNFKNFQAIAKEFKEMNIEVSPNMKLSDFSVDNSFKTMCFERDNHTFNNAFIISKKNSEFLQDMMKKIVVIDKKLKDMNTDKKLINKKMMVLYHSGTASCYYKIMENDPNYFYQRSKNCSKLANETTIDNFDSTWLNSEEQHKDVIKDENEIRFHFLNYTQDLKVPNYEDRSEIKNIKKALKNPFLNQEQKLQIWNDDSFWFDKLKHLKMKTEVKELEL